MACCWDIIVDMTSDQFGQAPVIVTRESVWHAEWDAGKGRPSDFFAGAIADVSDCHMACSCPGMEARGFGSRLRALSWPAIGRGWSPGEARGADFADYERGRAPGCGGCARAGNPTGASRFGATPINLDRLQ